ncbi:MAG: antitoxin [Pseudonocardiales bacterium]|nr:antitoxin [Pseudonocardiales bacterium]
MATLNHRLQVLLDDERLARLVKEAERRGSSVATLVREAIDTAFPAEGLSRVDAGRVLLDAEPIEVGDWSELKDEIEQMYQSHQ